MRLFILQFDPISDAAEDVYDSLVSDLYTRMQPLSFQDKLGVSQRLFAAIDEYVDHFRLHIFPVFGALSARALFIASIHLYLSMVMLWRIA